tara:strand:+ start:513 stop:1142 length:630 start_codon:yes stop_codon:yes gene_type:complete
MFNNSPDFEKIIFSKPVKCSDGKYFVAAAVSEDAESISKDILCQFGPNMLCKDDLKDSSGINLHFSNQAINDFISDCDEHLLCKAKDHKENWFPSTDITDTYLENALMPSCKSLKKPNNVYNIKMRISKNLVVFNGNKETVEKDDVLGDSKVSVIVQLAGLWFTKTRFGLSWVVKQLKMHESEKSLKVGMCLFENDDNEEELDNVFPDE